MNIVIKRNSFSKVLTDKKSLQWVENIILGILSLVIIRKTDLSVDVRILYIMAMGLVYGFEQSLFSAGFSVLLEIYILYMQNGFGNGGIVKVFEFSIMFFLIAIISGSGKTGRNKEMRTLRCSYDRLEKLNKNTEKELYDAKNAAVVLSEQLKTYEQSYWKLYETLKTLEGLEVDELINKVPSVVKEFTGFDKAVFYIMKDDGSVMDASQQRIVSLDEEVLEKIKENRRIFINSKMNKGCFDVILPVNNLKNGNIYGIITVSDVPFDKMKAYTWKTVDFAGEVISDYLTKSIANV